MRCNYGYSNSGFGCKKESIIGSLYCAEHQPALKSTQSETRLVQGSWGSSDYKVYIKSKTWQARSDLFRLTHNKCAMCNRKAQLHVHHRTYERLGHEEDRDLTVLCKDCHDLFHKHYEYNRIDHTFVKRKF